MTCIISKEDFGHLIKENTFFSNLVLISAKNTSKFREVTATTSLSKGKKALLLTLFF